MNKIPYFRLFHIITTFVVLLFILYFSFLVLEPFLFVVVTAFVFTIFINNIYEYLLRYVKIPSIAATLSIFLLVLFILSPILFIIGNVAHEARDLITIIQKNPEILTDFQKLLVSQLKSYGIPIANTQINLQQETINILKTVIQNAGGGILYAGTMLINTFFVLITVFFFLINKHRIKTFFLQAEIIPDKYILKLQTRTIELINGIVRGNLLVVLVQMIIATSGFVVFGLPAPLLLGLTYGLLSMIPNIGVTIIWVPVAIILFITQGLLTAALFGGWFVLSNLAVDNMIAPKIIGNQTHLHQLLIMFSVAGGIQQFGLMGVVLGPVIVALGFVVIEIYKELLEEFKHSDTVV